MQVAYDIKALGQCILDEMRKSGAMSKEDVESIAEKELEALAVGAYKGVKAWLKESAQKSENKLDDFVAPLLDTLDPFVIPQIEKIDLNHDGK